MLVRTESGPGEHRILLVRAWDGPGKHWRLPIQDGVCPS